MATSGVITGTMTPGEVIAAACDMLGLRQLGDQIDGNEAAVCLRHLTWMLKTWQVDLPAHGWRSVEVSWTHPAATASVTLSPKYMNVISARRRVSGIDTPLWPLSVDEYNERPNKSQAGTPTSYMVRKTLASLSVSVWPVPATDTTIYAEAARVIEDVTSLTQTLDVPQEWLETIYTCLAARIAAPLQVAISADIQQQALNLYDRLKTFDGEGASIIMTASV